MYGNSAFVNIDPLTTDPNDFTNNATQKFRCVLDPTSHLYYSLSVYGIYSNDILSKSLTFNMLPSCINYTFTNTFNKIIYNPCAISNTNQDCIFVLQNI